MTPPDQDASETTGKPSRLYHAVILLWIILTALFFFARFSFAFYYANEAAIKAVFGR